NVNIIENTDKVTGSGITIRDIYLDGLLGTGNRWGVYLYDVGQDTTRAGALITSICTDNLSNGVRLVLSANSIISNNTIQRSSGRGIMINSGHNNTVTGNLIFGNSGGVDINSPYNTVTGNSFRSNGAAGVFITASNNVVTGNNFNS